MPTFVPALAAWLRSHHGVVSRRKLIELGLTPGAIRALLSSGELVAVHDGVYRHAMWPDTLLSRCGAISMADARLVVCCGGATDIWNYRGCTSVGLHASSTARGLPIGDGIVVHRCPVMPSSHVHERPDGIRVTSPIRTVFDIAKHVGPTTLESVIEQGLRRGQFDVPALYEMGRLMCRRGRDGSTMFAQVVTSRPAWRRPVDSHPELLLLNELARHGVHLRTQVKVTLPDGQDIHPDLGDPGCGFYIEIDDHEWHDGRLDSTYDDHRDRQVRLIGGRVERVSTDEIRAMPPRLVADLVAAYRQHRSVSSASR
jgi:hypothetical protein